MAPFKMKTKSEWIIVYKQGIQYFANRTSPKSDFARKNGDKAFRHPWNIGEVRILAKSEF